MLVAFSLTPATSDDSGGVAEAVAAAVAVVKAAVDAVAAVAPRVSLVLKADIRDGYDGQLRAKVERLEQILGPMGQAG